MNNTLPCIQTLVKFSLAFLLLMMLTSCSGSDDGSGALTSAEDLSGSDFTADNVEILDESDLDFELGFADYLDSGNSIAQDLYFPVTSMASGFSTCNGVSEPKFTKNADDTFTLQYTFDLRGCVPPDINLNGVEVTQYTVSGYLDKVIFHDQDGNEVDVSGLTAIEVYQYTIVQFTMKYLNTMEGYDPENNTTITISSKKAVHAEGDFNAPCQFGEIIDGCVIRELSQFLFNNVSQGGDSLLTLTLHNIELPSDDFTRYYNSGTINFLLNNWTGNVTYQTNQNPTYNATNGNIQTSGTLY
jgi:hypothetical protein